MDQVGGAGLYHRRAILFALTCAAWIKANEVGHNKPQRIRCLNNHRLGCSASSGASAAEREQRWEPDGAFSGGRPNDTSSRKNVAEFAPSQDLVSQHKAVIGPSTGWTTGKLEVDPQAIGHSEHLLELQTIQKLNFQSLTIRSAAHIFASRNRVWPVGPKSY